jgi:ABC-type phosphate/phosphonate transport system substrate-binding protein
VSLVIKISAGFASSLSTVAWIGLCLFAPLVGVAVGTAMAQQTTSSMATGGQLGGLRHTRIYGVASTKTFDNVNRNDASTALKVLFEILGRQKGFLLDSRMDVVDDVTEIGERLKRHSADLIALDVRDYLKLEISRLTIPVLAHARTPQAGALYSYVLLVNASSAVTAVAGLRGKNLMVSSRNGSNTGIAWTEVLLGKEKLGRATQFFASIRSADKPHACIVPLFFGKVDACVVDEVNLNLAKEMNPQLGQLKELARSRPIIENVIATPLESHPYQKELFDAMLSLNQDPRGRQLLMVFKTDRFVRIQTGDLDSARELWRDYYRLAGLSPHRPIGAVPNAESDQSDGGKERH